MKGSESDMVLINDIDIGDSAAMCHWMFLISQIISDSGMSLVWMIVTVVIVIILRSVTKLGDSYMSYN